MCVCGGGGEGAMNDFKLVSCLIPLCSASTDIPSVDIHRYPRRRGKEQKIYREEEISDDDDYLCKMN